MTWNGHGDALNLLEVSGTTLAVANSFAYDSWGTPTTHLHPGYGDLGFRFLYVGRAGVQWDAGLGLHLMGARHYSPALSRFLQPDPPALEENLYAYVANNPLTDSDPAGTYRPPRPIGGGAGSRGGAGSGSSTYVPPTGCRYGCSLPSVSRVTVKSMMNLRTGLSRLPNLVSSAAKRFPRLRGWHCHHIWPRYMRGSADFPQVRLPASYHQLITNAFRAEVAYGTGRGLTAARIQQVMRSVYRQYPIATFAPC